MQQIDVQYFTMGELKQLVYEFKQHGYLGYQESAQQPFSQETEAQPQVVLDAQNIQDLSSVKPQKQQNSGAETR